MKKIDFARTNPIPVAVVVAGPTHRTTSELKLRKGAGRHYATQCILAEDSEVYLLRISGLWASVQHQQNFGWLPAQCLERLSVAQAATPPVARAPKPAPVITRGFTPRSAASPAEPADDDFIPTHRSTADLNLRKGSGTNYPVLRVLAADVLIRKLDEAGTWTKISTGQDTGWVPSAYLEQVNDPAPRHRNPTPCPRRIHDNGPSKRADGSGRSVSRHADPAGRNHGPCERVPGGLAQDRH